MTDKTLRYLAVAMLAALVITSALSVGAGVAAAQDGETDDGGLLDALFGDDDSESETDSDESGLLSWSSASTLWESYKGTAAGTFERFSQWGTEADAQRAADDVQTFVNSHNETIEQYINSRTTASEEFDVVAIEFRDDSGSDTRYLVADVSSGNYTNGRMVDSTERSVDETCELEDQAVANARDELDSVFETYIKSDDDVDAGKLAELNGQYQPDVACSFFVPEI